MLFANDVFLIDEIQDGLTRSWSGAKIP